MSATWRLLPGIGGMMFCPEPLVKRAWIWGEWRGGVSPPAPRRSPDHRHRCATCCAASQGTAEMSGALPISVLIAGTRTAVLLLARVFALPGHADPPRGFGEWLKTDRMQWGVPRASVAVTRNFGVAWAAGYGLTDIVRGVQVTTETLFPAALVSKPATAVRPFRMEIANP